MDHLICPHCIALEDGTKPTRKMQRRLNPAIKEVVKVEVLKLMDADIPKHRWQVGQSVPSSAENSGVIIIQNEDRKMVPTRTAMSWCICIDYRKLIQIT